MEALEGVVQFGDLRIYVCLPDAMANKPSSAKDFLVVKIPSMVEKTATLVKEINPKNILELGIFQGGSVVLYNELFKPRKFVAIDLNTVTLPHLEEYLRNYPGGSNVSLRLGVDQADRARLAEICATEFGGESLDLVIDDASHYLFETRESFRELFPRLRPGGVYIIEDWGWAHWTGDLWQRDQGGETFRGKEPMTNLIMELAVLSASKPDCHQRPWPHRTGF
jgi:predicted O-methyltransferase YrrM